MDRRESLETHEMEHLALVFIRMSASFALGALWILAIGVICGGGQ